MLDEQQHRRCHPMNRPRDIDMDEMVRIYWFF